MLVSFFLFFLERLQGGVGVKMLLQTRPSAQSFMLMAICYENNNTGSFAKALMQFLHFSQINTRAHTPFVENFLHILFFCGVTTAPLHVL